MRRLLIVLLAMQCLQTAFAQTVITNVTIVDVINKKLLPGRTVTIKDGKISDISQKKILAPGAVLIDGTGKFLMPGMTDAHIHFFQSGGLYARPDALDLRKFKSYDEEIKEVKSGLADAARQYVREGITTVFDVGATNNFLQLRDKLQNDHTTTSIYMSGPLITTFIPDEYKGLGDNSPLSYAADANEARAMVRSQLKYKPDLIKVWFIVDGKGDLKENAQKLLPVLKGAIDEAHANGLKAAVHATEAITAQLAVENGCDMLVHDIEDKIVSDDFISLLKKKNVSVCPTLTVMDGYLYSFSQKIKFSEYELKNGDPFRLGSLMDIKHLEDENIAAMKKLDPRAMRYLHTDSIRKTNLKKMADAGINIIAGTDAGNIGTLHATSYLAELLAMKESGMNNWQILQSATINPAKAMAKEMIWGSIAKGKKANLVLLNADPSGKLENLRSIELVINNGTLIKPDTLIKESPVALVQRQLNAYNAGNIDAFLDTYSDEIELFDFPDKLVDKGKEAMRKSYGKMFKITPSLHCEVTERIVQGNTIIDHEKITIDGQLPFTAVAIYIIENNKIRKVYFIQ